MLWAIYDSIDLADLIAISTISDMKKKIWRDTQDLVGAGLIRSDQQTAIDAVLNDFQMAITPTMQENMSDAIAKHIKHMNRQHTIYPDVLSAAKVRAKKGYVTQECANILTERGTKEIAEGIVWRHDTALYLPSPIRLTENQVLAFIRNISAPVCFILGTNGFRYTESLMDARKASVRDFTEYTLEGGHHVHMERPDEVATIFTDFLAKN